MSAHWKFTKGDPFRRLVFITALSLLAGLVASPAGAVINGRPDGPRHPNVGLLGIDFDGPAGGLAPVVLCSGFVISDSLFATAAHCIDVFGVEAHWVVTLEAGSPQAPVYEPGFFDPATFNIADFSIHADVAHANTACMHPDYDGATFEHDLAVLRFQPGTFDVRPVKLPEEGWLDHVDRTGSLLQTPLRLVGYGTEGRIEGSMFYAPGYRKTALTGMTGVDSNWLYYAPDDVWTGDTGYGDSGSPQILDGRAVSLQTFPAQQAQRLDTAAELDFLNGLLAGADCPR